MKPGGLERVRIGRETRQSIRMREKARALNNRLRLTLRIRKKARRVDPAGTSLASFPAECHRMVCSFRLRTNASAHPARCEDEAGKLNHAACTERPAERTLRRGPHLHAAPTRSAHLLDLQRKRASVCQWQPIESAPANGTAVLLFHPSWDIPRVGLRFRKTGKWQQPDGDLLR